MASHTHLFKQPFNLLIVRPVSSKIPLDALLINEHHSYCAGSNVLVKEALTLGQQVSLLAYSSSLQGIYIF